MIATCLLLAGLAGGSPAGAGTAQEVARPHVERYVIDSSASVVGFHGSSTLHDFTGRTHAVAGELRVRLDDPSALAAGELRVGAATLDTDNKKRDKKLRKLLDVGHFADIVFRIDGAEEALAAGAAGADGAGGSGTCVVTGTFAIHGVRRARRVPVEVRRTAEALRVRGQVTFDMSDHGIKPPRILLIKTADEIEVFFELLLVPQASGDEELAGVVRPISVRERLEPAPGGVSSDRMLQERLFLSEELLLWEREEGARWILADEHGLERVDHRSEARTAEAEACDAAFDALRTELEHLRRARPPATAQIARLERALEAAPAAGVATVVTEGERTSLMLGDVVWVEFEGHVAERPFATLLAGLPGLPAEVHRRLAELVGTPAFARIRCATPDGVKVLELTFGEQAPAALPVRTPHETAGGRG